GVVARIDDINATHTISASLQLNDPLEVSVMTTFETLNLTGNITPNGAGKSLTKFGFGNLRLAGDNSALNAPVNIVLGTLTVSNSHALGSGPVTVGFGSSFATLQLDTAGLNIANSFTIQGVTNLRTAYTTGTTTLSGPITLSTGTRITIPDA